MNYEKREMKLDKLVPIMIKNTVKVCLIALAVFLASDLPVLNQIKVARAALVISTDYTKETLNVTSDSGSTKFYMSSDNKKNWEMIDAGSIDISSYLSTKAVVLYFKGNKDAEVPITLPAEDNKSLTVAYKVVAGIGSIGYTTSTPATIQFRNGANGTWMTATGSSMPTAMYEIKGATLYFRTAATDKVRAGKIVNVKVPKRPTAPSINMDMNRLTFTGIKTGVTKYRINDNLTWLTATLPTGANYIDISSLMGGNSANAVAILGGVIEFRLDGDAKKVNSAVKVIQVPQQEVLADSVVSISGTSITINDSDKTKSYEYSVVPYGGTSFDINKAKWSTIPSSNTVTVKGASFGSKIYVRVKSRVDKTTKQVYLPSTYVMKTVQSN